MRASVIVPLILAALFGLGLRYSSPHQAPATIRHGVPAHASTPPAVAPIPPPKQPVRSDAKDVIWTVKATGDPCVNEKEARDSALTQAGHVLSEKHLKKLSPPIDWVPTPE